VEKPLAPDEKAEEIIAAISQAFGKILRGQGLSLREADAFEARIEFMFATPCHPTTCPLQSIIKALHQNS